MEIRGQIMGIRLSTLVENTKVPFEVPGHTVVVMVKRMQKKWVKVVLIHIIVDPIYSNHYHFKYSIQKLLI